MIGSKVDITEAGGPPWPIILPELGGEHKGLMDEEVLVSWSGTCARLRKVAIGADSTIELTVHRF